MVLRMCSWVSGWLAKVFKTPPTASPATLEEADWSESDAARWKQIVDSPTGRKMVRRAKAMHYYMMVGSTEQPDRVREKAYSARGFAECINWMLSLTNVRNKPEDKTMDVDAMNPEQAYERLLERLKT